MEVAMRRLLLLAPLPLVLSACVYTSAVPLGDPADAPLEEALVGDWLVQDENPDEDDSEVVLPFDSAGIRIQRFNQHEYLIAYEEWTCGDFRLPRRVERRLRAFVSMVDTTRFLNI